MFSNDAQYFKMRGSPKEGQNRSGAVLAGGRVIAISNRMKFRGSAAVALIGWILMAPSIDCARRGLQRETPLSEWERVDSFVSDENCENYRATVIEAEKSDSGNVYVERYSYSICVRDDDPRLKPQ
jgi:hypothetical protein